MHATGSPYWAHRKKSPIARAEIIFHPRRPKILDYLLQGPERIGAIRLFYSLALLILSIIDCMRACMHATIDRPPLSFAAESKTRMALEYV